MRSRILTLAGLLCLSTLLFFCKKEVTPIVEESPFFDFFNESSITIDTVGQAVDTWEYGFAFTPLKSGKITKLGVKIPATGNFMVTLWDLSGSAPVALKSQAVNATAVNAEAFTDISEIAVQKNAKLGVTVLANAFFRLTKPGNASFPFPKTINNIRIDSFNENVNNTATPAFPSTSNDTRVAPCVNVIFIAD